MGVAYLAGSRALVTNLTPSVSYSPSPSPTSDPTVGWKTYSNSKYKFSFKYPDYSQFPAGSVKLTDELVEIYGLDSMILRVDPIANNTDPVKWWGDQEKETSGKPNSCFTQKISSKVMSFYDASQIIIDLSKDVLQLETIKNSICGEPPNYRILIVPQSNVLLKIYFDNGADSEKILSTFTL